MVALVLNGFGQGMVLPLSLNTILSGVQASQAGMGAGAVTTMQAVGNAVGVTVVGVLLFSLLGHVEGGSAVDAVDAAAHVARYGHAFALATLYNVGATALAFVLFWRAWRRHA
jgi:hypothetical protein